MIFLKKAPFLKLIIPFIAGIILQSAFSFTPGFLLLFIGTAILIILLFPYLSIQERFSLHPWVGLVILFLMTATGSVSFYLNDIRNDKNWFAKHYPAYSTVMARIDEPISEKERSFRAIATVTGLEGQGSQINTKGKMIIYFKKDSALKDLDVGIRIICRKLLQPISNSGNPGGFDYQRYALSRAISHQVYLAPGEFLLLPANNRNSFKAWLFQIRKKLIGIIRRFIPGEKEQGFASAILIGYKDDLDKQVLQSYANTGVIHILAISGLHLGIIYGLLVLLLKPLFRFKRSNWIRAILIILVLWIFCLLAGGAASVTRSAVMFSCIVLGETLNRKASIYNTLAFSAFLLLCYNPFWLWEAGFQLSYAAVLSIVIFSRPVYQLFFIRNKILDFFWKLSVVSFSAQILTLPLCIFHFHQIPVYFLVSNIIAVPLAGFILTSGIWLFAIAPFSMLAIPSGKIISFFIRLMNAWIERVEALPFAVWKGLEINLMQTLLLFLFAGGTGYWLLSKNKKGLALALGAVFSFTVIRAQSFFLHATQKKIIVYNVPQYSAIDFLSGNQYRFVGDSSFRTKNLSLNAYIQPCRNLNRVGRPVAGIPFNSNGCLQFYGKKVLIMNTPGNYRSARKKERIDLIIVSKNTISDIYTILRNFEIGMVVFDSSTPYRKLNAWKKACDSLQVHYHSVPEKGAFVMNLN
ncbi:MAG: DUF4131 domain-containing protein [Terrimonas sp.]|nr:DUF4131 domain-containing protein [Terrimonas sp.]